MKKSGQNIAGIRKIIFKFAVTNAGMHKGKVLEWLKRQTWKVCNGRKPFAGSNPALSAIDENQFTLYITGKLVFM